MYITTQFAHGFHIFGTWNRHITLVYGYSYTATWINGYIHVSLKLSSHCFKKCFGVDRYFAVKLKTSLDAPTTLNKYLCIDNGLLVNQKKTWLIKIYQDNWSSLIKSLPNSEEQDKIKICTSSCCHFLDMRVC